MFTPNVCWCSGPVCSPVPEHGNQLHKSNSLPAGIDLPGQNASPPVRFPKGIRSNRLRKQGSSPGGALAGKAQGHSPAKALGVKRNGGPSRVVKATSVVQEEFIKVRSCLSRCSFTEMTFAIETKSVKGSLDQFLQNAINTIIYHLY